MTVNHTISVLVTNEVGVLSRIVDLFSGRGYNIESLTVAPTLDSAYSRVTIVGGEDIWIENYKGILEYSEDMVRLSNNICIFGQNLSIEEITAEDILIVGKIKNIEFE